MKRRLRQLMAILVVMVLVSIPLWGCETKNDAQTTKSSAVSAETLDTEVTTVNEPVDTTVESIPNVDGVKLKTDYSNKELFQVWCQSKLEIGTTKGTTFIVLYDKQLEKAYLVIKNDFGTDMMDFSKTLDFPEGNTQENPNRFQFMDGQLETTIGGVIRVDIVVDHVTGMYLVVTTSESGVAIEDYYPLG